ncbi:M15 family metallopeptidase [Cellulomonas sp. DKR-3]|uniref:M15 family metallopeptidase n=1 Tax=Cellulomonas fulva TaxID=2835530 RepID=A0ABS5TVH4_9CELL|nr:M15 family metallopeptidase [Cellulomonas fulva]MBT0993111.1 M15 family metallopeptidase [Cellulomonas fulva]
MSSVAAITQRMAEIQSLVAPLDARPASSASALGTATLAAGPATGAAATFDQVLATQTAGAQAASTARNADGVPVDLARYGNGRIPTSALGTVDGTSWQMWAPAADGLSQLLAAARRDGVSIGINDAYRSYDEQVDMVRRKGLYSQGGLAAEPGTSQHGWGLAADLQLDGRATAWMQANAERFGFERTLSREPWHWEYTG